MIVAAEIARGKVLMKDGQIACTAPVLGPIRGNHANTDR